MPCGFCDSIADMFRYDIFGSDVGRLMFCYIGKNLATSMTHVPQESSHETEESAQEIADLMPSLKVERNRIDRADPWSRGKTMTRLIEVVHL